MTTMSCPTWAQRCYDCGREIPGGTWRQYVSETGLEVRHINGCPRVRRRPWKVIAGGVGLGVCSACRAPGAFWYPQLDVMLGLPPGVWLCDSCVSPDIVRARIDPDIQRLRKEKLCS